MSAHLKTAVPFNISGPDRMCQGTGCRAEASYFYHPRRHHITGLPIIEGRWCGGCLPAGWLPGRA